MQPAITSLVSAVTASAMSVEKSGVAYMDVRSMAQRDTMMKVTIKTATIATQA